MWIETSNNGLINLINLSKASNVVLCGNDINVIFDDKNDSRIRFEDWKQAERGFEKIKEYLQPKPTVVFD